jgi:hypothetical protein
MARKYGILLPRRLKDNLQSGNWWAAVSKDSNHAETWSELKEKVPHGFDELLLLVKHAPRSKLYDLIPPEKIEEFTTALLHDPAEEDFYFNIQELRNKVEHLEAQKGHKSVETQKLWAQIKELEMKQARYFDTVELDTLKVAQSLAVPSIDYFEKQLPKLVNPAFVNWMTGPMGETKYRLSVILNEAAKSALDKSSK